MTIRQVMRNASRVAAALSFAVTSASYAMLPDSGWWWNLSKPAEGYNIEIQNNLLFMSAFVYDAGGNAIWLTAGGPMSSDRDFTADIYQTSAGYCIGCTPNIPVLTKFGSATITFVDELNAIITINGVPVSVYRSQFGIDLTNVATPLLGEWTTVAGTILLPVYFGDRITFPQTMLLSGGLSATGTRTGDPNRLAVGSNINGTWAILIDSSPAYYDLYVFTFNGLNRLEGSSATYLKGTTPTGSLPFVGQRIRSAQAAAGLNAPGVVPQSLMIAHNGSAADTAAQARTAMMTNTEGLAAIQEAARVLEAKLEAVRAAQ